MCLGSSLAAHSTLQYRLRVAMYTKHVVAGAAPAHQVFWLGLTTCRTSPDGARALDEAGAQIRLRGDLQLIGLFSFQILLHVFCQIYIYTRNLNYVYSML